MRASTPRELHALMAFAHELRAIKELYAQREWAMHEPTDFADTEPPPAARVVSNSTTPPPAVLDPLRLSVNRSSARR
jgi:hypothetical protein